MPPHGPCRPRTIGFRLLSEFLNESEQSFGGVDVSRSSPTDSRICSALNRLSAGFMLPGRCQPSTLQCGDLGSVSPIHCSVETCHRCCRVGQSKLHDWLPITPAVLYAAIVHRPQCAVSIPPHSKGTRGLNPAKARINPHADGVCGPGLSNGLAHRLPVASAHRRRNGRVWCGLISIGLMDLSGRPTTR